MKLCKCGHEAGAHDDEPTGCWHCACEAWSVPEEPDELEKGWWALGTHPDSKCLDCGGRFWHPPRCPGKADGSHRYPPWPG